MGKVLEMMKMRTFMSCALALAVTAGCSQQTGGETSIQSRALELIASSGDKPVLQDARILQLAQSGGPQMKFGIEDLEIVSIAFQDTSRDGIQTWIVLGGFSFVEQDGIISNTRGLVDDQMSTDIAQTRAAVLGKRAGSTTRSMTFIGSEDAIVKRTFDCTITKRGARTLTFDGKDLATTLMAEDCSDPADSFTNLYWVRNATGKIVQSRQWGNPEIGAIVLRTVTN